MFSSPLPWSPCGHPYRIPIVASTVVLRDFMRYLESIAKSAAAFPDAVAVSNSEGDRMTYRELWETSESLSSFLRGGVLVKALL